MESFRTILEARLLKAKDETLRKGLAQFLGREATMIDALKVTMLSSPDNPEVDIILYQGKQIGKLVFEIETDRMKYTFIPEDLPVKELPPYH